MHIFSWLFFFLSLTLGFGSIVVLNWGTPSLEMVYFFQNARNRNPRPLHKQTQLKKNFLSELRKIFDITRQWFNCKTSIVSRKEKNLIVIAKLSSHFKKYFFNYLDTTSQALAKVISCLWLDLAWGSSIWLQEGHIQLPSAGGPQLPPVGAAGLGRPGTFLVN